MLHSDYMLTVARWHQKKIREDVERFRESGRVREAQEQPVTGERPVQRRRSDLRRKHA
ncbi:MAG: hypothetical protein AAFU54_10115 [Chloroflexota bacterium]